MKSPIFLFSLPRSGSTLLQRILMAHEDITSVAEPWILLPFCYASQKEGTIAEYGHNISHSAVQDFIDNLPEKSENYYRALGHFAFTLYEQQCRNNEKYFLDKTPRYYNIIPQIVKIFPDAKFIFLFRNPVHVMSSIMETWSQGNFKKMFAFERDLIYGPQAISKGYKLLEDRSYSVQYEKFVSDPVKYTKEICAYLEIDFKENMLRDFSVQETKGRMGDPTGIKEYRSVESVSLEKWKKTFNTSFRKKYIRKYIEGLDKDILEVQGYDKKNILSEISRLKVSHKKYFRDKKDLFVSNLISVFKLNLWFGKGVSLWAVKRRYIS